MNLLALDIGMRRTGIALGDTTVDTIVALDTIVHETDEMLVDAIDVLAKKHSAQKIVVGMPLLLSGSEGEQAEFVRTIGAQLSEKKWEVSYLDERFTTTKSTKGDGDAQAACALLQMWMKRNP